MTRLRMLSRRSSARGSSQRLQATARYRSCPPSAPSSTQTSVSGISSGAYMAGQFEIAHSRDVVGAAIIAGGPYGCSESLFADVIPGPGTALLNLTKAINGCMLNALQAFGVPNPAAARRTRRQPRRARPHRPRRQRQGRPHLSLLGHGRPHGRAGDRRRRAPILRGARRAGRQHPVRVDNPGRARRSSPRTRARPATTPASPTSSIATTTRPARC